MPGARIDATALIRNGNLQCASSRALALGSRGRLESARHRCDESRVLIASARRRGAGVKSPVPAANEGPVAAREVIALRGHQPTALLRHLVWELGLPRAVALVAASVERFAEDPSPLMAMQLAALRDWLARADSGS